MPLGNVCPPHNGQIARQLGPLNHLKVLREGYFNFKKGGSQSWLNDRNGESKIHPINFFYPVKITNMPHMKQYGEGKKSYNLM